MNISNIRKPVFSSSDHMAIDVLVDVYELGCDILFTASSSDSTGYGEAIYADAISGKFGAVAPYLAPVQTPEQKLYQFQIMIQSLNDEANSVIVPLERAVKLHMATDAETEKLKAWEKYSVELSRVDTSNPDDALPDKPE